MKRREILKTLPLAGLALIAGPRLAWTMSRSKETLGSLLQEDAVESRLFWNFDCCGDFFARHYFANPHEGISQVLGSFVRLEKKIGSIPRSGPVPPQTDPLVRKQLETLHHNLKTIDVRESESLRKVSALVEKEILLLLGAKDCHLSLRNVLYKSWDELTSFPQFLDMNARSTVEDPGSASLGSFLPYEKTPEPYLHIRLGCYYWGLTEEGEESFRKLAIAEFKRAIPHCSSHDRNEMHWIIRLLK